MPPPVAIQVKSSQVFVAPNSAKFAAFLAYLDARGYTKTGALAKRVDNVASLTVTLEYPAWGFELP